MCTVIGAESRTITPASPHAVWLKTIFEFRGNKLYAHGFLSTHGNSEVFTVQVDLLPLAAFVARYHNRLHGKVSGCIGCTHEEVVSGCIGCAEVGAGKKKLKLGKALKSIAKAKAIKAIAKAGKAIIKSKVTGALVAVAATVYPPVGAPALAAYTAANVAINAVEKAQDIKRRALKVPAIKKLDGYAKKVARSTAAKLLVKAKHKGLIEKHGKAKVLGAIASLSKKIAGRKVGKVLAKAPAIKRGIVKAVQLKKALRNPKTAAALTRLKAKGNVTTNRVRAIVDRAKAGDVKAKKAASILSTVAEHRARMEKRAPGVSLEGVTGLMVDCQGHLTHGRFRRLSTGTTMSTLVTPQGSVPGYYEKVGVGSCVGCDAPRLGYPIGNYMLVPGG